MQQVHKVLEMLRVYEFYGYVLYQRRNSYTLKVVAMSKFQNRLFIIIYILAVDLN